MTILTQKASKLTVFTIFVILIITLLGFYIRIKNIGLDLGWSGDSSRDFLVGYHIAKYNEKPLVGHYNSGLNFYYPPYYYYLISMFMRDENGPFNATSVSIVFHSLSIIVCYGIGLIVWNNMAGILFALYFAFSRDYINTSKLLITSNAVLPFYMFSLFLVLYGIKYQRFIFLVLGSFMSVLLSATNSLSLYTNIFLVGSSMVYRKKWFYKILLTLVGALYCYQLMFLPIIIYFGLTQYINRHINFLYSLKVSSHFALIKMFSNDIRQLFDNNYIYYFFPVIGMALLLKKSKKLLLTLSSIVGFYSLFTILSSGYKEFYPHYQVYVRFVYLLLASILLAELFHDKNVIKKIISLICAICIFFSITGSLSFDYIYNFIGYDKYLYKNASTLTNEVLTSMVTPSCIQINTVNYPDGWFDYTIWYFIENIIDKKYLKLFNYGNTLYTTCKKPDLYLFVCGDGYYNIKPQFCDSKRSVLEKTIKRNFIKKITVGTYTAFIYKS